MNEICTYSDRAERYRCIPPACREAFRYIYFLFFCGIVAFRKRWCVCVWWRERRQKTGSLVLSGSPRSFFFLLSLSADDLYSMPEKLGTQDGRISAQNIFFSTFFSPLFLLFKKREGLFFLSSAGFIVVT